MKPSGVQKNLRITVSRRATFKAPFEGGEIVARMNARDIAIQSAPYRAVYMPRTREAIIALYDLAEAMLQEFNEAEVAKASKP